MQELINADRDLFLYLNNLGSTAFDGFWLTVSEKWTWIPLYVMFLYLLYKNYRLRTLVYLLIFIALGITIADQLAGIFKYAIMRLRPCHDDLLIPKMRIVKCGGSYGFFSSHASNSFFIATFMSFMLKHKYKFLPIVLFFWASVVAYSRIYLGVHFPMDIVMGAGVGFFLGGFFSTLAYRVMSKQQSEPRV